MSWLRLILIILLRIVLTSSGLVKMFFLTLMPTYVCQAVNAQLHRERQFSREYEIQSGNLAICYLYCCIFVYVCLLDMATTVRCKLQLALAASNKVCIMSTAQLYLQVNKYRLGLLSPDLSHSPTSRVVSRL